MIYIVNTVCWQVYVCIRVQSYPQPYASHASSYWVLLVDDGDDVLQDLQTEAELVINSQDVHFELPQHSWQQDQTGLCTRNQ